MGRRVYLGENMLWPTRMAWLRWPSYAFLQLRLVCTADWFFSCHQCSLLLTAKSYWSCTLTYKRTYIDKFSLFSHCFLLSLGLCFKQLKFFFSIFSWHLTAVFCFLSHSSFASAFTYSPFAALLRSTLPWPFIFAHYHIIFTLYMNL